MNRLNNYLLIFGLIAFGVVIRLYKFDVRYPQHSSDIAVSYLVSHHIVRYNEIILSGGLNALYDDLISSPIYFFTFAFLLLFHDHILFLGLINIFLQVLGWVSSYLLASHIFNKRVAIITILFFVFSRYSINQSESAWQPYITQPFSIACYLALYLGLKTKKLRYLFLTAGLFLFSSALGPYQISTLPTFFIVFCLVTARLKKPYYSALVILLFSILVFFVFHLWALLRLVNSSNLLFFLHEKIYITSLGELLTNIKTITVTLITDVFLFSNQSPYLVHAFFISTFLGMFLFVTKKNARGKKFLFIFIIGIFQPILLASLVINTKISTHQFTPIICLLFILTAITIDEILSIIKIRKLIPLIILFLIGVTAVTRLNPFVSIYNYHSLQFEKMPPAIINEIKTLRKIKGLENNDFFQIDSFFVDGHHQGPFDFYNALFLVPLEKKLQKQLVILSDNDAGFTDKTSGAYLFIICHLDQDYYKSPESCLKSQKHYINKSYWMTKKLFSNTYTEIYVYKKLD